MPRRERIRLPPGPDPEQLSLETADLSPQLRDIGIDGARVVHPPGRETWLGRGRAGVRIHSVRVGRLSEIPANGE